MGKKRRAQPVVAVVKSRKKARKIVTTFHKVSTELDALERDKGLDAGAKEEKIKRLQGTLEEIGGRAAYQAASQLSVSFHNTSKWVLGRMAALGLKPKAGEPPLRVLEVGAINTTLLDCPWLATRAIDLLARHDRIQQLDFFHLPPPPSPPSSASGSSGAGSGGLTFQAIVSSMVLNSVPTPEARGEMLRRCHGYLQRDRGHLFLMLPRSCLTHSRQLDVARFREEVLPHYGFRVVEAKESPKVAFFVLQAGERGGGGGQGTKQRGAKGSSGGSKWAKDFDIALV